MRIHVPTASATSPPQYILTVPGCLLQDLADDFDHSPTLVPTGVDDGAEEVPWPVETLPVDQFGSPRPGPLI